ncbi:MAG TPA: amidohydrolase family protein [Clostridia bacterium]|nr:amidohydrolase family protein [Clostridia bacterium]
MVIDFHVHCFADELAQRAVAALEEVGGIPARSDGTVSGIRSSMKKAGVDKSVVLNIATKPQQTTKINQWAASIQADDIIPFGTLHPDFADWKAEMARICSDGLKGIKFHPDYQQFYVDDPKMFPIYEKAAEEGLVVIFHAGLDIGLPAPYHCTPDRLHKVVREFRGTSFVAAHMGGYRYWDDVERFLVGEDLYFDTSFGLGSMSRQQFDRIALQHGYDKLLFATDSPWEDQTEEVESIRSIMLPAGIEKAVLGENAAKLLGLTC